MRLTLSGINAAIMIASSTTRTLPEKSSSAFVLMSWIGRANLLIVTVTSALDDVVWTVQKCLLNKCIWMGTYWHLE